MTILWPKAELDDLRARDGAEDQVEAYAAYQRARYFPALDGLRALAIGLVLLHHAGMAAPGAMRWSPILQQNGRYGVGLFFLISGFLICTLLLREQAESGGIELGKFYARRALRLLPLYYGVLLMAVVLVFGLHQYSAENRELFRQKLPGYVFYYSNWLPSATQGPFFCAWSLAVEEQFYLVFGVLLCFLRRRIVVGIVTAALLVKAGVYLSLGAVDANSEVWRIVFSYREPILLGVLLAFVLEERRGFERVSRWLARPWLTVAAASGCAWWLMTHAMKHESAADAQLLYGLMAVVMAGLVVNPKAPVVSGRFLSHVGKVSYGIYLLHVFVFSAVRKIPVSLGAPGTFLGACAATILLASLVHRYFERPIIAFYKERFRAGVRRRMQIRSGGEPGAVVVPIGFIPTEGNRYAGAPAGHAPAAPSLEVPASSIASSPQLPI